MVRPGLGRSGEVAIKYLSESEFAMNGFRLSLLYRERDSLRRKSSGPTISFIFFLKVQTTEDIKRLNFLPIMTEI